MTRRDATLSMMAICHFRLYRHTIKPVLFARLDFRAHASAGHRAPEAKKLDNVIFIDSRCFHRNYRRRCSPMRNATPRARRAASASFARDDTRSTISPT